ncbi:restriction endonuclease subunit S [Clostridium beijerinckii]|uniref:restriction endonuclease subunit S n=1 Tax=Clostridium beijerinckii TaxID=1520 RepID=UPI00136D167C|nr:restriction endonuclease subunit S [Clostridium beijerinckii]
MKKFKLGEIYDIYSGLSKSRGEFGRGYPFLTFKEVFNNYFMPDNLENLVNSTEKERERCSIKRGDIFLTRTSETANELGMSCVALKDYDNATFNGFTKRLRLKKGIDIEINPEYIGYYLRSPKIRNYMSSLSTMTTRASLNSSMINNIVLELPEYDIQVEIGKMLKVLDDKIELNNNVNKTLEEMAQAIFKSWFVDFEPFQDGEFEDSELGKIPKGWRVGTIGDYVKVKSGFAFKSIWWKDSGVPVIKIKNISNNTIDFHECSFVENDKVDYAKDFKVSGGDLLIAMTGATIGKFAIVPQIYPTMLVNQRVGKFFLGENPILKIPFIYGVLNFEYVQEAIIARGTGSAQPNISPTALETIKLTLPPKEVIEQFNYLECKLFSEIVRNQEENQILTDTRDTLLPKLMSGEIRVPLNEV